MCGIIAVLAKDQENVPEIILQGLHQLQNRGYDSAGISIFQGKDIVTEKYASDEGVNALSQLSHMCNFHSYAGIGHTRWATHGVKSNDNAHPHISYDKKVALVHNGIIENYQQLRQNLQRKNISFHSQTDTEVIAHLIAYHYQAQISFREAIQRAVAELEGTWGLAILNQDEPNKLYCIRQGSPLLVSPNASIVLVGSEQSAFSGKVNDYFVLETNDLCEISLEGDALKVNTDHVNPLKRTNQENFDLSPDPYPHWTLKEIKEQYEAASRALSFGGRLITEEKVKLGGLEHQTEVLKRIDNIIFLACGTSYYAAMLGTHYFKEICKFHSVQVIDGADFSAKDIPLFGNTALVLLSQSGETKDLHRCIEIGLDADLFLLGIVNVVDSMIAREVHCGVYLNAGREVGVASTKCFTNQVIILAMLAVWFGQLHNTHINRRKEYIKNIRQLPQQIQKCIAITEKNKDALLDLLMKENLFILGKGKSEAIAKEGALKIKEISYIHAEGYSASALKHGPFALLNTEFPVIMIAPEDEHYSKMQGVYEEVASREAPIIFITTAANCAYKNALIIPRNRIFDHLLCVIPLQILAYHLSLKKGINPDFPRNLAKSVVVE